MELRKTKDKMHERTTRRFCESGGVYPPEHLCEFASAAPAQAFVSPRKAATTLCESGRQCSDKDKN
jgi:hypothetical protein